MVVASGSLANLPWKTDATAEDPVQAAKDDMKKFAEAIKANKHIVVGGGGRSLCFLPLSVLRRTSPDILLLFYFATGAVGLELIGEIVDMYKDKQITLVDAREALLPEELGWNKSVGKRFEGLLKNAGVKVIHNARVTSPEASTFESTSITLSDGTALHGLYVAATGVKPRSGFLPKELLTEKGFVDTSPTFQCKADPSVWALGDAANHERKLALSVGLHVPVVASNLFKVMAKPDIPSSSLRQYKGDSRTIMGLISFGKGAGGGQAGPIRFPGVSLFSSLVPSRSAFFQAQADEATLQFMVSMIKGKDLLASKGAALI